MTTGSELSAPVVVASEAAEEEEEEEEEAAVLTSEFGWTMRASAANWVRCDRGAVALVEEGNGITTTPTLERLCGSEKALARGPGA